MRVNANFILKLKCLRDKKISESIDDLLSQTKFNNKSEMI